MLKLNYIISVIDCKDYFVYLSDVERVIEQSQKEKKCDGEDVRASTSVIGWSHSAVKMNQMDLCGVMSLNCQRMKMLLLTLVERSLLQIEK